MKAIKVSQDTWTLSDRQIDIDVQILIDEYIDKQIDRDIKHEQKQKFAFLLIGKILISKRANKLLKGVKKSKTFYRKFLFIVYIELSS